MNRMPWTFLLIGLISVVLVRAAFAKNGTVGIYAVVDNVVFEPNEDAPDRIRIFGMFIVPVPRSSGLRDYPQQGYLYYSLPAGRENAVKREWLELKKLAGSGKGIGFADYWTLSPRTPGAYTSLEVRIRKDGDTAPPDVYPNTIGILESDDGKNPEFNLFVAELKK